MERAGDRERVEEILQERSKGLPSANGHTKKPKRQTFNSEFSHEVFQHFLVKLIVRSFLSRLCALISLLVFTSFPWNCG